MRRPEDIGKTKEQLEAENNVGRAEEDLQVEEVTVEVNSSNVEQGDPAFIAWKAALEERLKVWDCFIYDREDGKPSAEHFAEGLANKKDEKGAELREVSGMTDDEKREYYQQKTMELDPEHDEDKNQRFPEMPAVPGEFIFHEVDITLTKEELQSQADKLLTYYAKSGVAKELADTQFEPAFKDASFKLTEDKKKMVPVTEELTDEMIDVKAKQHQERFAVQIKLENEAAARAAKAKKLNAPDITGENANEPMRKGFVNFRLALKNGTGNVVRGVGVAVRGTRNAFKGRNRDILEDEEYAVKEKQKYAPSELSKRRISSETLIVSVACCCLLLLTIAVILVVMQLVSNPPSPSRISSEP